jgi:hypothetical protein
MVTEVSHGRGGAGNINPDDTKYVDGEVTREGVVGSHGDGAFSAGRGGEFRRGRPRVFACVLGTAWLRSSRLSSPSWPYLQRTSQDLEAV